MIYRVPFAAEGEAYPAGAFEYDDRTRAVRVTHPDGILREAWERALRREWFVYALVAAGAVMPGEMIRPAVERVRPLADIGTFLRVLNHGGVPAKGQRPPWAEVYWGSATPPLGEWVPAVGA